MSARQQRQSRRPAGPRPAVRMTPRLFAEMVGALKAGKSQQAIARDIGLSFGSVQRWLAPVVEIMREHGGTSAALAPGARHRKKLSSEEAEEIGRRVATAGSLREIARDMGVTPHAVQRRARPIIDAMRQAGTLGLCKCGKDRFHPKGCIRTAGVGWQAGRERAPNEAQLQRRSAIIAEIMRGDTFAEIGERHGIGHKGASHYLRYLSPEQRERRNAIQWRRVKIVEPAAIAPAHRDDLYARIAAAVPRWPSDATREDAISDLYLAVLEGSVAAGDVAAEANRYATKAVNQWESRFGPRSLDELAFEDGRETLGDMIADPATLEPLEWRLSA